MLETSSPESSAATEQVLWRLTHGPARAEARVRTLAAGTQLRLYMSAPEDHRLNLVWSRRFQSGPEPGSELLALADEHRCELETEGWRVAPHC